MELWGARAWGVEDSGSDLLRLDFEPGFWGGSSGVIIDVGLLMGLECCSTLGPFAADCSTATERIKVLSIWCVR